MTARRRPGALFADAGFYRAAREIIAPHLRTWPYVNVWLVGAGTGEDAYALAIVLREEGLDGRLRIHATDADAEATTLAREGSYDGMGLDGARARYLESGGRASLTDYLAVRDRSVVVNDDVKRAVLFAEHSLDVDASFAEVQLVVCRSNALTPFDPITRRRAWGVLHESLCRFGLLAVDPVDGIGHHPLRGRYEIVDEARGIFKRGDA